MVLKPIDVKVKSIEVREGASGQYVKVHFYPEVVEKDKGEVDAKGNSIMSKVNVIHPPILADLGEYEVDVWYDIAHVLKDKELQAMRGK